MSTKEFLLPQEKCGITAVLSKKNELISPIVPILQSRLHHRGRDSAGMATYDHANAALVVYKHTGSVRDAFQGTLHNGELITDFDFKTRNLLSDRAIGHNRYGTSGDDEKDSILGAQPITVEWEGRTLALAFNGNIPEHERNMLQERIPDGLEEQGNFDTVDLAQAIITSDGVNWRERIKNGLEGVGGAYSLTVLTDSGEVFGLRGPSGTWPLWVGESDDTILFSSESIIDTSPRIQWSEVHAGELVQATPSGIVREQLFPALETVSRCSLHDVYGAKPDSLMTKETKYRQFRELVGRQLAREYPIDADVYAGVPNTGLEIAHGFVAERNVSLSSVFRVADGSERSYISQNPEVAINIIKGKFLLQDPEIVRGKSIALIEDSIIKGSTMGGDPESSRRGIVQLLRNAGALEVHVLLGLPTFIDECDLGYYVRKELLVALKKEENNLFRKRSTTEIAEKLGADSVNYISIDGLKSVYSDVFQGEESGCMACLGESHPLSTFRKKQEASIFQATIPYNIDNSSAVATMVKEE